MWFGLALALAACSQARAVARAAGLLGLAPLHALTMELPGLHADRDDHARDCRHSGRPLAADNTAWTLYLIVQARRAFCVAAALWLQPALPC